jgi:prolipoprotein diacylglyceryltransferase
LLYAACVLVGIVLSLLVRRRTPEPAYPHRFALSAIAILGATSGALLFEVPADVFGWTAGVAGEPAISHALGGRTVLGGLLGGWSAVEVGKIGLGITQPTGDGFALPVAISLACGRVGCFLTGCCAGRVSSGGEWWAALALPALSHDARPRFPAQLAEVLFHVAATLVLFWLARRGGIPSRRFAAYLVAYSLFRFGIEGVRDNPSVAFGLTYYQLLAVPLFALAAVTFVVRSRPATTRLAACGSGQGYQC